MNKLEFPNRVTVELTNRCNVSCTFCHRQVINMELGDMSFELYKKIIDEMAEHVPIKMVPFFRGESIMHPQFVEFMKYAKQKGIGPIQLFSNGLIFNKAIAEAVIEAKVDFVSFSLDTVDKDIYKDSRVLGNLEVSMENVRQFGQLCKEYREKGIDVPEVQVSTVDLDIYRPKQQEFIDYWKKYVDVVRIYEEHDENGRFVKKEVSDKLSYISERRPCHKLYSDMIIYWDGRIALCNYDWDETHALGDANKQSLVEIWNSEIYENIRRMHETDTISDDYLCSKCEHWKAGYLEEQYLGKRILGDTTGE